VLGEPKSADAPHASVCAVSSNTKCEDRYKFSKSTLYSDMMKLDVVNILGQHYLSSKYTRSAPASALVHLLQLTFESFCKACCAF
jgi:hypothetical protein